MNREGVILSLFLNKKNMKIKFIKPHPAGISEGRILEKTSKEFGQRMIKEGFAESLDIKEEKKTRRTKELKK